MKEVIKQAEPLLDELLLKSNSKDEFTIISYNSNSENSLIEGFKAQEEQVASESDEVIKIAIYRKKS